MTTQRRVQIDFEILLEYPLLDIDHSYIGPQQLPLCPDRSRTS